MIVHGIPGPVPARRRRHHLDRHRRDARRLGGRRGAHVRRSGRSRRSRRKLLTATEALAARWRSRSARRATASATSRTPIQEDVEDAGLSVVRSLVGHGVGRDMHEDPQVPNYGQPGKGPLLEEGMVLAVEPMVDRRPPRRADGRRRLGDLLRRTARWRPTSSSPSPSPPTGPRMLTPWHLPPAERAADEPRRDALRRPRARLTRRLERRVRGCYHANVAARSRARWTSGRGRFLVAVAAAATAPEPRSAWNS